jgi:tetratricopeptide (TPR) repeat protein
MIVKNNKFYSMKTKLTILFLAVASIAMAQKREMRKIEKAIESNDFSAAVEEFNSIDESDVEAKYEGPYSFYKAATTIGVSGESNASEEAVYESLNLIKKAVELGYDNEELISSYETKAKERLFSLANEKLKSNDTKGALVIVNYLSDADTSNLTMYYNAARLAYQAGEFDTAKEKYQTLIDKEYTGEEVTYTAVKIADQTEEKFPSKRLRDFSVTTSKTYTNPKDIKSASQVGSIVTNLVWLYKNEGDMDKAKGTFENALIKHPSDESLKFAMADIYLTLEMMDEYKEATESLTQEVKDPKVYDNLAISALNTKDYDQAIKYYELSIGIAPNNFVAQANLGLSYVEKGNLESTSAKDQLELYKNAIACYEKAHQLKPEDKTAISTLISLYGVFDMSDKVAEMKAKL